MTLTNLQKAPFPWFGGKSAAAAAVWAALGDVDHYVEPFAGSLAVLLNRPHRPNRTYHSETVNDLDALLVNFWRAVQFQPGETAEAASWPVAEFDKHARSCALLAWRESEAGARLAGDPLWCDPVMAGWWVWAVSCQIGAWGAGGPWWPDETGRLRKGSRGVPAGLPHLGNDGRGVNHAGAREPGLGVPAGLPHLGNDGQGVNRPQAREPGLGVPAGLPHLGGDGQGVNHPGAREPGLGVPAGLPHLGGDGQGVNHPGAREPGLGVPAEPEFQYHPLTMPEVRRWFAYLSARLRHVRILNGDWTRAVTNGASKTLPVRQGGHVGIFLDPPYGDVGRASVYGKYEDLDIAGRVRAWALQRGTEPDTRIVYAGYDEEGADLEAAGWRVEEWFTAGWLKGGMGNVSANGTHQQHRERLWLSPHCLQPATEPQGGLW